MVGTAVGMLAFVGIPILSVVFSAGFPGLYSRILPRVSKLDAAAYARPIIEREAALQVKSEREFYGRPAYERNRWAEDILKRLDTSDATRRRQLAERLARQTESYLHGAPLGERLRRYSAADRAAAPWSAGSSPDGSCMPRKRESGAGIWPDGATPQTLTPLSAGLGADVAGLFVGLILGIGLTWIYSHYLEGAVTQTAWALRAADGWHARWSVWFLHPLGRRRRYRAVPGGLTSRDELP